MNKFMTVMLSLVIALFVSNAFAWDPPASPVPTSWISDSSSVLSSDAHARLDAKLKLINQGSANEIAVLILPDLGGSNIEDVTNATFKSWGVGKKDLDNGVLIVLSMAEHKMRIETGKGVEGDLPDLMTQDILNNVMRPKMRNHDVEGALASSFDAIANSIANHKAEATAAVQHSNTVPIGQPNTSTTSTGDGNSNVTCTVSNVGAHDDGDMFGFMALFTFVGMIGYILYAHSRRR